KRVLEPVSAAGRIRYLSGARLAFLRWLGRFWQFTLASVRGAEPCDLWNHVRPMGQQWVRPAGSDAGKISRSSAPATPPALHREPDGSRKHGEQAEDQAGLALGRGVGKVGAGNHERDGAAEAIDGGLWARPCASAPGRHADR